MDIKFPDYDNSIVNLACSVLKHYGAKYNHPALPIFDNYLMKDYKNVVVMVFDGLGTDALEYHLEEESFLRKHLAAEISSVFPPTTTAATTSMESGLTPVEHGWLGWSLYFSEIDKIVNAFINTVKDSDEIAADYHVAGRIIPYKNIYDIINETGNAKAYSVSPFGTNKVSLHAEMFQEVERLCDLDGNKYIYAYFPQPDSDMHEYGCYSEEAASWVKELNRGAEEMSRVLKDTILIITADHGHINLKYKFLTDYPEILRMLIRQISIENRAACFYVKDEYKEKFPEEFYKVFGDDFLLFSREKVIEGKLFGDGEEHPKFQSFVGDYLAVAISDKGIAHSHESAQFVSNHAGITRKEMMVPFIAVER
ncbi:MAG: alkaline phosphatase family protein [Clostridiaceae bacterium]